MYVSEENHSPMKFHTFQKICKKNFIDLLESKVFNLQNLFHLRLLPSVIKNHVFCKPVGLWIWFIRWFVDWHLIFNWNEIYLMPLNIATFLFRLFYSLWIASQVLIFKKWMLVYVKWWLKDIWLKDALFMSSCKNLSIVFSRFIIILLSFTLPRIRLFNIIDKKLFKIDLLNMYIYIFS